MKSIHILFIFLLFSNVYAQNNLSIDEAVNIALKNNYDILVAKNDAESAKINNTPGNAGMLPTIGLTGSGSFENNNVSQKLQDGSKNQNPSLSSASFDAGTELSWTLFNGGKMFVTKNKLGEIEKLGEIQFKDKVLQTQYNVIAAYYNVAKQKQQLKSFNEAVNYNKERVKIAQTGYDAGSLIKTDLLQAKIDLNVSVENYINQQYVLNATRKDLNKLLGQDSETVYNISDTIPLNYSFDKNELLEKLSSSNTSILSLQKQIDIDKLAIKENEKLKSPVINLNAGYYYSQTINSDGSVLNNLSFGPQVGGKVVIPIYSAGENKRKISNARLQLQSTGYYLQNTKLQVYTEFQNTLTDFENQQQLLVIESDNNTLAKENLEISLQRLRHGQTTSLEVHQAQEDYIQSCTRLTDFRYNLKIAETKLKQMVSML
jgi:outer membrane protein